MRVSQSEWKATQNRLEYLKDKLVELNKMRAGMEELHRASQILLLQMAIQYGGEDHTIVLHRADLNRWTADVDRDPESGTIMIRAKKEEA